MTANEVLVRQLERQLESFLKVLGKVPDEKLDWTPAPGMRSALDQAQEVATVVGDHWSLYEHKKLEWSEEGHQAWLDRRKELSTREEVVAALEADTARLIAFTRATPASDLMTLTQLPFPGEYRLVDNITYHVWNMAYHEGQISALLLHLGLDPMPME